MFSHHNLIPWRQIWNIENTKTTNLISITESKYAEKNQKLKHFPNLITEVTHNEKKNISSFKTKRKKYEYTIQFQIQLAKILP